MIWTLGVLIVTALACAIPGTFLVLRKHAMVADALSHTILLGIVLAYFITKDIASPFLIISAAIFGVITVYSIEALLKTGLVKSDSATGLVFPLFFAIAVILISKYARNVHIDNDVVLMGEVIFASLNKTEIFGLEIPKAFLSSLISLLLNSTFIAVFFKELKLLAFDAESARLSGFSEPFLNYALMTLVSLTAVSSFEAVGAILVISFFITPAAIARLLTKSLKSTIFLSAGIAVFNSVAGWYIANKLNVSMAGSCAVVAGILWLAVLVLNKRGLINRIFVKLKAKKNFRKELLILHIGNHQNEDNAFEELGRGTICAHINWPKRRFEHYSKILCDEGYVKMQRYSPEKREVTCEKDFSENPEAAKFPAIYLLSEKGEALYAKLGKKYGI